MVKSIATMKKMIKNLMLVAVAAMAFVACSQEGNEVNILTKETTIEFTASLKSDDTRSSFGEKNDNAYPSYWSGNEEIAVLIKDANDNTLDAFFAYPKIVEGSNGKTATFTGTIYGDISTATQVLAFSGKWTNSYTTPNIYVEQTPTDNSVEESMHILKAEINNWDGSASNLSFKHAVAYGRLSLPAEYAGKMNSVKISFNDDVYAYTINTADLEGTAVWFACPAFAVNSFAIDVDVDGTKYTKERTDVGGKLYFETGKVTEFTVKDLQEEVVPDTATATLVTDIIFNGYNPYDVKFEFATGEKVTLRFNTGGKEYLHLGDWQSNDWQQPHYISDVKLVGGSPGLSSCNVAYADDKYTITMSMYDWDNSKSVNLTYVGAIEGLVAPEECDCFAPVMTLSTNDITFIGEGESKTINVTLLYTDESISVSTDNDHFTASVEGNVITVTAPKNETESEITGTLTVTCGELTGTVSLTQVVVSSGDAVQDGTELNPYVFGSAVQGADWWQLVFSDSADEAQLIVELNSYINQANPNIEYSLAGTGPWYGNNHSYIVGDTTYFYNDFAASSTGTVTKKADGTFNISFKIVAGGKTTYYTATVPADF